LDVAVIARVPFDEGSLTGNLTDDSRWPEGDWRNTYFGPANLRASVERAEALRPLMAPGMTMPDMALRFILSNPDVSTVIPGMRKTRHVEANLAASDNGALDAGLQRLRRHRWDRKPLLVRLSPSPAPDAKLAAGARRGAASFDSLFRYGPRLQHHVGRHCAPLRLG
jgi:aryl-alcohol dehydrogenase-like predicted oxidoreductase